jgi:hypothetical protein
LYLLPISAADVHQSSNLTSPIIKQLINKQLLDFSLNGVSDNDCEGLMKKFSMSFELIADARKNCFVA